MSGFGNLKLVPFRTKPPGRKRKPPPLTFFNLFCLERTLGLFGQDLRISAGHRTWQQPCFFFLSGHFLFFSSAVTVLYFFSLLWLLGCLSTDLVELATTRLCGTNGCKHRIVQMLTISHGSCVTRTPGRLDSAPLLSSIWDAESFSSFPPPSKP